MSQVGQEAIAKLKEAVAHEDAQSYMEPPRLYQPVRLALGSVLLNAAGDAKSAVQVQLNLCMRMALHRLNMCIKIYCGCKLCRLVQPASVYLHPLSCIPTSTFAEQAGQSMQHQAKVTSISSSWLMSMTQTTGRQ